MKAIGQREMVRRLVEQYGENKELVCQKYAEAERRGEVIRQSNEANLSPEQYAHRLYDDGDRKGWFRL